MKRLGEEFSATVFVHLRLPPGKSLTQYEKYKIISNSQLR